eukprot:CAMPEP_0194729818 /NCGR_PEP_ID=MMETSP0296-20130528/49436_1 /TAXON_ID=39354 /ORGANISM="Heterosigma akashiwo, Strain CCMP2393" /LENGTH=73 /DNA_ID=CAMNT_0039636541 /DNA_START=23 /DNA_END=240 /DNA_ORIENTATION=+
MVMNDYLIGELENAKLVKIAIDSEKENEQEKLANQLTSSVKMAYLPLGVFEDYLSSKPSMKQAAYCFPSKLMG